MKKTLALFFSALFLISCFNDKSENKPESGEYVSKNKSLTENIVRYYFFDIVEKAEERTEFIVNSLKKDRDFMLSVFVEDYFSAPVLSSAEKYTSPKIDYCAVFRNGELLSQSGENRNFENYTEKFNVINDSLWIILKHYDSDFFIITATLVKNSDFTALSGILSGNNILVLYDSQTFINSTINLDGKSVVLNLNAYPPLTIGNEKFGFDDIKFDYERISVLVLTK